MLQRANPHHLQAEVAHDFRQAMRGMAGSVCAITVEGEHGRTGCVATSVSSFSVSPPMLVFSLASSSSTARALQAGQAIGVNLLAPEHDVVAAHFAGFAGASGEQRYHAGDWVRGANAAWLLADAPAAMACTVDEVLLRHGHLLVFARVEHVHLRGPEPTEPLMYWQGTYRRTDWSS